MSLLLGQPAHPRPLVTRSVFDLIPGVDITAATGPPVSAGLETFNKTTYYYGAIDLL